MEKEKQRDAKRTRETILQAATEQFAQLGLHGARMDDIAAAAHVNKSLLYQYYGNKQSLYRTVLEAEFGRMARAESEQLALPLAPLEMMAHMAEFYFDYPAQNPQYIRLLLWENLNNGAAIGDIPYAASRQPAFDALRQVLQKGQQQGVFRRQLDAEQFILSELMLPFSHFSNQHTLSSLLGQGMYTPNGAEARKAHIRELLLTYITA